MAFTHSLTDWCLMTSKSQLAAHHTQGLAASRSSAGGLPQPPIPISVVLSCFIGPAFTSASFLPSVLLTFHGTQMLQVRYSAHLHLFHLVQRGQLAEEAQIRWSRDALGIGTEGAVFQHLSKKWVALGCSLQLASRAAPVTRGGLGCLSISHTNDGSSSRHPHAGLCMHSNAEQEHTALLQLRSPPETGG